MLSDGAWKLSQQNQILFVLVDGLGNEVSGLGTTWVLQISKAGAAFVTGAGTKAEISNGFYQYLSTSGESNTVGALAVKITHASIIQQNLTYVVEQRTPLSVSFTYTVTDDVTLLPLDGVCVMFTTDSAGSNIVWTGFTDSLGVARDLNGQLPRLDPGTYFVHKTLSGHVFATDSEVVV